MRSWIIRILIGDLEDLMILIEEDGIEEEKLFLNGDNHSKQEVDI